MATYGTSDHQPLPSYSPSARNSLTRSFGNTSTAPGWPVTFEAGVETVLQSPATSRRDSHDAFAEHSHILKTESGHGRGTSTFREAVFNSINVLLGVGVLSSPFAMRSSGWLIGVPLFLFFVLVTNHTGKLLGKCLEYQEGMMTYPDIGEAAFGTRGRKLISVMFFAELFTVCVLFDILIGDTLAALLPAYTPSQLMVAGFVVVMPTLWTAHLSMLSWFSLLGIISSFFCLYAIFFVGFAIDYEAPDYTMGSLLRPQPTELIADADRIPLAIGMTMVAFGDHSVFPSICSSMQNRADFPAVLDIAYVVTSLVYGAIEVGGYLMFGNSSAEEITLNLVDVYPGTLMTLMIWMVAFNPMSKVPITIHPVALAIEELLFTPQELHHATYRVKFYRALVRTTIGVLALLCALYIPSFARLTSFLGAFFAMFASVFFPCVCYLKLFGHRLNRGAKILNASLAVISVFLTIVGTISSFVSPTK
ncbi:hypothetical protein Poli38472_010622 [Pythium oligandrum]|uniref:Amino acid transporter transmembrane domain-containing protein n=1 Tax=Pythium oligandrum TaxID=41045 RepID=A0A8K1F9Z6_PYTOL|nr:hypothetical protein Poli38472_010622 [Pythium oligandrum]|eukprot:TMW55740.1 hypothetical protein Poli38472_010622 [Pythium oligandrum]